MSIVSRHAFLLHAPPPRLPLRRPPLHVYNAARRRCEMPAFMPVGTQAAVKGLTIDQLRATGARDDPGQHLSPGAAARRRGRRRARRPAPLHGLGRADPDRQRRLSALQPRPSHRRSPSRAAVFRSHIDGRLVELSPERAVAIQEALGSDVAMVLDHVVALPNERRSHPRRLPSASIRWAAPLPATPPREPIRRSSPSCKAGSTRSCASPVRRQLRGAGFPRLRGRRTERRRRRRREMYRMLDATVPRTAGRQAALPDGRGPAAGLAGGDPPRHRPVRLRHAHPQRPQRHGLHRQRADAAAECQARARRAPARAGCPCAACRRSRGYLRHLFMADEMLGPILLSIHNLTYYQRLLADARPAIERGPVRAVHARQAARLGRRRRGGESTAPTRSYR